MGDVHYVICQLGLLRQQAWKTRAGDLFLGRLGASGVHHPVIALLLMLLQAAVS
jgi:hypothetical protein